MDRSGVLKIFLILTISVSFISCGGLGAPDLMPDIDANIKSMTNCTDPNEYVMVYRDVKIDKTGKNTYTLAATIATLEEIPAPVKVSNKVDACGTAEKYNCQFFTEMISEDACDELDKQKGQLYKTFEKVNMEHIRCPIPADSFVMQPYTLQLPKEAKAMVARSEIWEVESKMSTGDKVLSCMNIKLEIKPKEKGREGKRKGGKKKE